MNWWIAVALRRVVWLVALVVWIASCGGQTAYRRQAATITPVERTASIQVVDDAGGQGTAVPYPVIQTTSTRLRLRGLYTFVMQVDPDGACEWPVTTFYWPVSIKAISYEQDTALGSIVFPPTPTSPSNTWRISAGPGRTQLVPQQGSPGPAGGAYDVVVDGGSWEAGGLVRARDGRGEIREGTGNGARQILMLRGSDKRWECRSEVKWSLLIRYGDRD